MITSKTVILTPIDLSCIIPDMFYKCTHLTNSYQLGELVSYTFLGLKSV